MDNGKVMGRRQFFSKFFPVLTETIIEKTKDETKISANSSVVNSSVVNSSVVSYSVVSYSVAKQADILDKVEVTDAVEESGVRKFPWVGM